MTLGNLVNPVFIASILVFSIAGLGIIIQDVSADHGEEPGITKAVVNGSNTLSFRDIANTAPQTSTLTLDMSQAKQGLVTINLEELDANLDSTAIDLVIATANSTTSGPVKANVTLTETGIATGIFSGTLFLSTTESIDDTLQVSNGDSITASHEEESQSVGRLHADLEIIHQGNVKITDVLLDFVSLGFNTDFVPVTHSIKIASIDGAKIDSSAGNAHVITISYANVDLLGIEPSLLSMYYKPGPFEDPAFPGFLIEVGWDEIRDPDLSPGSHNAGAKTITSDVANSEFGIVKGKQIFGPEFGTFCCPTDAEFMLAFKTGSIGGGGGGGLVRPGFVVNALAGASVISSFFGKGGAGSELCACSSSSAGPSKPTVTSGTVSILSDESIGFVQQGVTSDSDSDSTFNSLDSTQNIGIGEARTFQYNVYENTGADNIIHATMYFFDAQIMDSNKRIDVSKSETYIMYEKGKPVKVVDPYGYFEKAGFEISAIDTFNSALKYEVTFGKIMPESHIVLRTWDSQRWSTDTLYENAIVVSENSIADNDTPSTDKDPLTQSEFEASPFLDTQYEGQLTKEETTTKTGFPGIPQWVKNNAMWWHEKQIDDEDFVAGIQYMINEEIITIPETTITSSTAEGIPQWVSNVAGYWSNDQIPDDQFIQAMQWLISNGVMEV